MAEPQTIGGGLLVATLAAALGPLAGEWLVVLAFGFLGSCLALTEADTGSRRAGLLHLLRGVLMAMCFTSLLAWLAAPRLGASFDIVLPATAALLGWSHDKVGALRDWVLDRIKTRGVANGKRKP